VSERKCTECKVRDSANRKGKPGRCVNCIDARYTQLGMKPLGRFVDSQSPRRCACLVCGQIDEVAYAEIRNQLGHYCSWCTCRKMYEDGLAAEPQKWDITVEQAAEIVLGGDFIARAENSAVLDATGLAARMEHVWSPVKVECIVCGTTTIRSATMTLGTSGDPDRSRCWECFARPLTVWQGQVFEAYGLVRDRNGYARIGEKVDAHCMEPDCGADRRISIADLMNGVAPCLDCAEAADPDAPHIVYLMHFPSLRACKIGITSSEVRHDRIASHVTHGGVLLGQYEVPNREAARTVEDFVLSAMRDCPSGCAARDFPQGGYTETWSDVAPDIDLDDVITRLASEEAPGFDRLSKLRTYFNSEPATIEELVEFRQIRSIDVNGTVVHQVGFSEPLDQVLRKIRARRAAPDAGVIETA
jgi:hypothetical protein